MAEIVNLRTVRKDRARAEKRDKGDENAARFGRTRALKALEQARNERAEKLLDAHRRGGPTE